MLKISHVPVLNAPSEPPPEMDDTVGFCLHSIATLDDPSTVSTQSLPICPAWMEDDEAAEPIRFNNYIVLNRLGRGSFANVYKAAREEDGDGGKYYALKVIENRPAWVCRRTPLQSPLLPTRGFGSPTPPVSPGLPKHRCSVPVSPLLALKRRSVTHRDTEIAIWKKLRHKNICPVIEAMRDANHDVLCIVMPLLQPSPFTPTDDGTVRRAVDVEFTRRYFLGVLRGVRYLHRHNIVHWDLKLENVLYDPEDGEAKIVDFGTSEKCDTVGMDSRVSSRGTMTYWPPEMLREDVNRVNGKAVDMWALGVMLFAAFEGALPFHGACPSQLSASIARGVPFTDATPASARSLIAQLLSPAAVVRPTAEEARLHQFFTESIDVEGSMSHVSAHLPATFYEVCGAITPLQLTRVSTRPH